MITRKSAAAILALVALAAPTAATAAPGKGKSGEAKAKVEAKTKKKGHAKAKNAVFKGSVVSVDGSTVTVHVEKANKWGRSMKGTDVAFDVSGLKKAVTVGAGDAVLVQARITKDDVAPLKARKLNKLEADEPEDDDEAEAEAPAPVS